MATGVGRAAAPRQESVRALEAWIGAQRRCGLSDVHVQMARELGMNPKRLIAQSATRSETTRVPLAQHIEDAYVRRFGRAIADPAVSIRQLVREARVRERTEAQERRRRKRQATLDHLEAIRVSLLTLRRLYGGPGASDDYSGRPPTASNDRRC